jgi:hypothetical protein
MAIDTKDRRASVLNIALSTRGILPTPRHIVAQTAKMFIVYMYIGIGVAVVDVWVKTTSQTSGWTKKTKVTPNWMEI